MKIEIAGYEIPMSKSDVKLARNSVSEYIDRVRKFSQKMHRPSFFFTAMIIMNVLSQHALDMIEPETLSEIMTAFARLEEQGEGPRETRKEETQAQADQPG